MENLSKTHQIGPECTQQHSYGQYACSEHNSNMFCRRLEHILDFGGPKSKLVRTIGLTTFKNADVENQIADVEKTRKPKRSRLLLFKTFKIIEIR